MLFEKNSIQYFLYFDFDVHYLKIYIIVILHSYHKKNSIF